MHRLTVITTGLLVIVFTAFGCAQMRSSGQADAGWITLFDGSNFNNWYAVGDANWRLAGGAVEADQGRGFLVSRQSYANFQTRIEFWASDDANSGIYMRCSNVKQITDKTCYEANIYDQRPDPKYGTGAIVHIAAISPMPKAGGKWNTYEITVKGSHLSLMLNGVRTVEADDSKLANGPIALQYAAGVVKFRKVQIKPL